MELETIYNKSVNFKVIHQLVFIHGFKSVNLPVWAHLLKHQPDRQKNTATMKKQKEYKNNRKLKQKNNKRYQINGKLVIITLLLQSSKF